jgi:hypothetical protein
LDEKLKAIRNAVDGDVKKLVRYVSISISIRIHIHLFLRVDSVHLLAGSGKAWQEDL